MAALGPDFWALEMDLRSLNARYRMPYQGDAMDDPATSGLYFWQRWEAQGPGSAESAGQWVDYEDPFEHTEFPASAWNDLVSPYDLELVLTGR